VTKGVGEFIDSKDFVIQLLSLSFRQQDGNRCYSIHLIIKLLNATSKIFSSSEYIFIHFIFWSKLYSEDFDINLGVAKDSTGLT
jgi:hypothetical protein